MPAIRSARTEHGQECVALMEAELKRQGILKLVPMPPPIWGKDLGEYWHAVHGSVDLFALADVVLAAVHAKLQDEGADAGP